MRGSLNFHIAFRYFRGLRSANLVPILSRISMVAIGISSGAMIVLFSIMNGFEFLIQDLYKAFYPPIRISATEGKFFQLPSEKMHALKQIEGVEQWSCVLEDQVLLTHFDEQKIATVKGVDNQYFLVNPLEDYLIDGTTEIRGGEEPTAVLGLQLANELGLDLHHIYAYFDLHYPNAEAAGRFSMQHALRSHRFRPVGMFQVQDEFDGQIILADLQTVQHLFGQPHAYSSIELKVAPGHSPQSVQKEIRGILDSGYKVETLYEQNQSLFMVMKMEKWAIYGILVLVMLIASFNMVGGLTMLALEKQKDMAILRVMGATPAMIRRLFYIEGLLWALVGGAGGLLLGWLVCLGQMHFGWIQLSGSFIIHAYPIRLVFADFLLILFTVAGVGLLAAAYPAARASKLPVSLRAE